MATAEDFGVIVIVVVALAVVIGCIVAMNIYDENKSYGKKL